jgi:RNase P subunit RPR2
MSDKKLCPNCHSLLWQELNKIWTNDMKHNTTGPNYTLCDNWHCNSCGSVFTNKELNKIINQ